MSNQEIGSILQTVRMSAGYRQGELAKLVGVTKDVISNIERGITPLRPDLRARLARVLGLAEEALNRPVGLSPARELPANRGDGRPGPRLGRQLFPVMGYVGSSESSSRPGSSEDSVEFSEELLHPSRARFAIRVLGDSLEPRILHGDFLLVHPSPSVASGLIAIAKNQEHGYLVMASRNGLLEPLFTGLAGNQLSRIDEVVGYVVGQRRETRKGEYMEIGATSGMRA